MLKFTLFFLNTNNIYHKNMKGKAIKFFAGYYLFVWHKRKIIYSHKLYIVFSGGQYICGLE